MSGPAVERVNASLLEEIVFTNSIPFDNQNGKRCPCLKQLSIAPLFADTIKRIINNEPISVQYTFQKY